MSVDQLPYQIILVIPFEQVSYLKLKYRIDLDIDSDLLLHCYDFLNLYPLQNEFHI